MPCTVYLFVMHTVKCNLFFAGGKIFAIVSPEYYARLQISRLRLILPSYFCYVVISAWGIFAIKKRNHEKRKNLPHAKISTLTVYMYLWIRIRRKTPPSNRTGMICSVGDSSIGSKSTFPILLPLNIAKNILTSGSNKMYSQNLQLEYICSNENFVQISPEFSTLVFTVFFAAVSYIHFNTFFVYLFPRDNNFSINKIFPQNSTTWRHARKCFPNQKDEKPDYSNHEWNPRHNQFIHPFFNPPCVWNVAEFVCTCYISSFRTWWKTLQFLEQNKVKIYCQFPCTYE